MKNPIPTALKVSLVLLSLIAFQPRANAIDVSLNTIAPEVTPRDGTQPPQPGTELFVFPMGGSGFGQQYTAVFDVSEEPAAVVGIPMHILSYQYEPEASQVTVVFEHVPYLEGVELFGPPTDFSLAFIPAVGLGQGGPPAELRGSWMSTNISPSAWQILPPSLENPSFGYSLSGPDGGTGFFEMFIPQALIDLLSTISGSELTIDDLAVFNGENQASISVRPVNGGGASVDIQVIFSEESTELPDAETAAAASLRLATGANPGTLALVTKDLSVSRAESVSLTADNLTVPKGTAVRVYGWVKDGAAGEKVKLLSKNAQRTAKKRGEKALKRYKKNGLKTLTLDSDGYFSHSFTSKKSDTLSAVYKAAGEPAQKSGVVQLNVTR